MPAAQMTRRSLLLAAGGALAGTIARPPRALATLAAGATPALTSRWIGALGPHERTLALAGGADLLGLQWRAPADAHVQLRFLGPDGHWSDWLAAGSSGHAPEGETRPGAHFGDPLWTGGTRLLQLRSDRALAGVRLHLIDVSAGFGAHRLARAAAASAIASFAQAAALPLAAPSLAAGAGQPPIIARSAWARGVSHPRVAPEYGAVKLAFVHHTENPNGYLAGEVPAMLRAIFAFHREVRGWNDIGYNFVVDAFGRIFEARAGGIDEPVVGAQAGGYNLVSTGVAVLGSFGSQPISTPARDALARLLAWKLALHGVPAAGRVSVRVNPAGAVYSRFPANARVSLARISGHRDADSTDCPGDALYGELAGIRAAVHRLAPQPVLATLALSAAPVAGEPPPAGGAAGASGGLAGALVLADGTALAGATVQIQARSVARRGEVVSERTLAQVQCDAAGRWSLPGSIVPGARAVALRALYAGASAGAGGPAGAGAAVSPPLTLVKSALSPPPAPAPTPAAAPAPAS